MDGGRCVYVIGGGASGLAAAYEAAVRGHTVILFEQRQTLHSAASAATPGVIPVSEAFGAPLRSKCETAANVNILRNDAPSSGGVTADRITRSLSANFSSGRTSTEIAVAPAAAVKDLNRRLLAAALRPWCEKGVRVNGAAFVDPFFYRFLWGVFREGRRERKEGKGSGAPSPPSTPIAGNSDGSGPAAAAAAAHRAVAAWNSVAAAEFAVPPPLLQTVCVVPCEEPQRKAAGRARASGRRGERGSGKRKGSREERRRESNGGESGFTETGAADVRKSEMAEMKRRPDVAVDSGEMGAWSFASFPSALRSPSSLRSIFQREGDVGRDEGEICAQRGGGQCAEWPASRVLADEETTGSHPRWVAVFRRPRDGVPASACGPEAVAAALAQILERKYHARIIRGVKVTGFLTALKEGGGAESLGELLAPESATLNPATLGTAAPGSEGSDAAAAATVGETCSNSSLAAETREDGAREPPEPEAKGQLFGPLSKAELLDAEARPLEEGQFFRNRRAPLSKTEDGGQTLSFRLKALRNFLPRWLSAGRPPLRLEEPAARRPSAEIVALETDGAGVVPLHRDAFGPAPVILAAGAASPALAARLGVYLPLYSAKFGCLKIAPRPPPAHTRCEIAPAVRETPDFTILESPETAATFVAHRLVEVGGAAAHGLTERTWSSIIDQVRDLLPRGARAGAGAGASSRALAVSGGVPLSCSGDAVAGRLAGYSNAFVLVPVGLGGWLEAPGLARRLFAGEASTVGRRAPLFCRAALRICEICTLFVRMATEAAPAAPAEFAWGVQLARSLRPDGRESLVRLRGMSATLAALPTAAGSARFRQGRTAVLAAVQGPVETAANAPAAGGSAAGGAPDLRISVRAPHGPRLSRERSCESHLLRVLPAFIDGAALQHTQLFLTLLIEAADGGVLACALNAALCALLDAGVPCRRRFVAVAAGRDRAGGLAVDPSAAEVETGAVAGVQCFLFAAGAAGVGELLYSAPEVAPGDGRAAAAAGAADVVAAGAAPLGATPPCKLEKNKMQENDFEKDDLKKCSLYGNVMTGFGENLWSPINKAGHGGDMPSNFPSAALNAPGAVAARVAPLLCALQALKAAGVLPDALVREAVTRRVNAGVVHPFQATEPDNSDDEV